MPTVFGSEITPTLISRMTAAVGNTQDGLAVVTKRERERGYESMSYQEQTGSLLASGYNKPGTQEAANDMFVTDSPAYSATVGDFMVASKEQTSTLMARDYKDPPITTRGGGAMNSVVRRLTPLE